MPFIIAPVPVGLVAKQLVDCPQIVLAAALRFASAPLAVDTYTSNPQCWSVKTTGTMRENEDFVAKSTICFCGYDVQM